MRSVIVFNMITADGYFAGPHGELDWHNVNAEFNDFALAQLDEADTLIFGRRTYDIMAAFWPTEIAKKQDPVVATKMNDIRKLVFTHTLENTTWRHTTIIDRGSKERLQAIKAGQGKTLLILGSSELCVSLFEAHLIDEVRLMVNPVILGAGMPLFAGLPSPHRLHLIDHRAFKSGNVLLRYTTHES